MSRLPATPRTVEAPPDSRHRLFLATSRQDPRHLCLVPVPMDRVDGVLLDDPAFPCACGQTFAATLALLSWSTEYAPRCLSALGHIYDERKVPG